MTSFISFANWLHRQGSARRYRYDATAMQGNNMFAVPYYRGCSSTSNTALDAPAFFDFSPSTLYIEQSEKMSLEQVQIEHAQQPKHNEMNNESSVELNYLPELPAPIISKDRRTSTSRLSNRLSSVFSLHTQSPSARRASMASTTTARKPSGTNLIDLLCTAAAEGDTAYIGRILGAGGDVSKRNTDGFPPLHVAAMAGQGEAVRCLVRMGASVSARDQEGYTALQRAVIKGQRHIIVLMVNLGANVDETIDGNKTALHIAAGLPSEYVAEPVVEPERRASTASSCMRGTGLRFSYAFTDMPQPRRGSQSSTGSSYDECSVIEALVRAGANKECRDANGDTPLHIAVKVKEVANVRILLDQGVAINVRNDAGQTPLEIAADDGASNGISELLFARGAVVAPLEDDSERKRKSSWFNRATL